MIHMKQQLMLSQSLAHAHRLYRHCGQVRNFCSDKLLEALFPQGYQVTGAMSAGLMQLHSGVSTNTLRLAFAGPNVQILCIAVSVMYILLKVCMTRHVLVACGPASPDMKNELKTIG